MFDRVRFRALPALVIVLTTAPAAARAQPAPAAPALRPPAARWVTEAAEGARFRLAFDQPGT